jgi:hypothetical protein
VWTWHVRTDGFLPAQTKKSVRGINADVRGCPDDVHGRLDEKDVRTVNFTVGRPFRHLYDR